MFFNEGMEISSEDLENISKKLSKFGEPLGLEFHIFCIGWYNNKVENKFKLDFPSQTLAFCVVSSPKFFENSFLPFIESWGFELLNDPFDQCMISKYDQLKGLFSDYNVETIHDFELHSNRRPKLLVQSAGHVSGAAFYYQKQNVESNPWKDKRIYGVSNHPKYGGWFGFRGALILKDVLVPFLKYKEPVDLLSEKQKVELLERFNFNWKDWTFRDVRNESNERYSELQQKYFQMKPSERKELFTKKIDNLKN